MKALLLVVSAFLLLAFLPEKDGEVILKDKTTGWEITSGEFEVSLVQSENLQQVFLEISLVPSSLPNDMEAKNLELLLDDEFIVEVPVHELHQKGRVLISDDFQISTAREAVYLSGGSLTKTKP